MECKCQELNSGALAEQQALLKAESSLQPPTHLDFCAWIHMIKLRFSGKHFTNQPLPTSLTLILNEPVYRFLS